MRYSTRFLFLTLGASLTCGTNAQAQHNVDRYARIVVIQPRSGQDSAFEAGYQRHLAWHRAHRDPWTWRGWSFVLGDRLDAFMDGTFGHQLSDFDSAVDPAGDGADNHANVEPYAQFLSHAVYERLDEVSAGTALPDASPYTALTTLTLIPGQSLAFEQLLATARRKASNADHYGWYRLVQGGAAPTYLLLRPAPTFASAAGLGALPKDLNLPALVPIVREIRTEVMRYRTEMSYSPERLPD